MLKHTIAESVKQSIRDASGELNDIANEADALDSIRIERPRNPDHGDYAVNVSPLARWAKKAPPIIAETIAKELTKQQLETSVIAGFINLRLDTDTLARSLQQILTNPAPGKNASMDNETILLEYVSANPTGPLHIGHGRWAALGDSLKRIWEHCGAVVTPEFYINDAGVQMMKIAESLYIRCREILLEQNRIPQILSRIQEPPYPGEYVIDAAKIYLSDDARTNELINYLNLLGQVLEKSMSHLEHSGYESNKEKDIVGLGLNSTLPFYNSLIGFCKTHFRIEQQQLLEKLGVHFEAWFSELEYLHNRKNADGLSIVQSGIERLKQSRFAYEQDDALWLKSTEFGDEKDRVLIKSDGSYTYLAADIAYHDQKFNREDASGQPQYSKVVNIWGADHHGYIARLKAAMAALDHISSMDDPKFEIVLGQLVNLKIDGERTRMGKRRKMLTLEDVVNEVGVDATRFWMVAKSADTTIDFDVDLAQSQSNENPVYYAQYAHARCCSILRNAVQENPNIDSGEMASPFITEIELNELSNNATTEELMPLWVSIADDAKAIQALNQLLFRLDDFEEVVTDAARLRSPHVVARYTLDLAADFHSFYNVCRILTDDTPVTKARLGLIIAIRNTLQQGLKLLGVSAPEQM